MRCLYCGKELALLKRLRGGGDFCSDAHKQSYQEEYNRLALGRLLQAQKKGKQAGSAPAETAAPPPNVSVALEDLSGKAELSGRAELGAGAELNGRAEWAGSEIGDPEPDVAPVAETVLEIEAPQPEPPAPVMADAASNSAAQEESSTPAETSAEGSPAEEPEPEPAFAEAGFLFASFPLVAGPDSKLSLEPWVELSPGPAMSEWQIRNGPFSLSPASLLLVEFRPQASAIEHPAISPGPSPETFASAPLDPALSSMLNAKMLNAKQIGNANRLEAGGVITIDIAPSAGESIADQSLAQGIGFESTALFEGSELLELAPTAIDFPAEDVGAIAIARSDIDPQAPGNSPRASLQALSRLHQELADQEGAGIPEGSPVVARSEPRSKTDGAARVTVVKAASVEVVAPPEEPVPDPRPQLQPAALEITAVEIKPETEQPKPKYATEFFELPIKTFAPGKAALTGGDSFPIQTGPLLPALKSLPLRPKVALATGYVPPAKAARAETPSKAASGGKPAARLTQPKQLAQPAKAAQLAAKPQTPSATPPVTSPKTSQKAEAKPITKLAEPQPKPVAESSAAKAGAPQAASKPLPAEKEQVSKAAPAEAAPPKTEPAKPKADQPKPPADQTKKDNVPNFGAAQPANASWLGSLKLKLGLAILILVIACAYFLGWGGKSRTAGGSNAALSSDGSGPSIILGEGGWVEGWGGDPVGMHAGRQITIYRPSLKLSDYRLEFQGSIDTKSVGWVFRASDPDNYYAMKLMTVASGLSAKVALFKYLVANGKQTQVGRVPIDLAVQPDTVFDIRVDVRGPQFSTYIQGQQVDGWTDDQLKAGGVGFLNEREERGKVKSVSIRYLKRCG